MDEKRERVFKYADAIYLLKNVDSEDDFDFKMHCEF